MDLFNIHLQKQEFIMTLINVSYSNLKKLKIIMPSSTVFTQLVLKYFNTFENTKNGIMEGGGPGDDDIEGTICSKASKPSFISVSFIFNLMVTIVMIASAVLCYNSNTLLKNPTKYLQNEISALVANPPFLDEMSITLDTDVNLDYKKKLRKIYQDEMLYNISSINATIAMDCKKQSIIDELSNIPEQNLFVNNLFNFGTKSVLDTSRLSIKSDYKPNVKLCFENAYFSEYLKATRLAEQKIEAMLKKYDITLLQIQEKITESNSRKKRGNQVLPWALNTFILSCAYIMSNKSDKPDNSTTPTLTLASEPEELIVWPEGEGGRTLRKKRRTLRKKRSTLRKKRRTLRK